MSSLRFPESVIGFLITSCYDQIIKEISIDMKTVLAERYKLSNKLHLKNENKDSNSVAPHSNINRKLAA